MEFGSWIANEEHDFNRLFSFQPTNQTIFHTRQPEDRLHGTCAGEGRDELHAATEVHYQESAAGTVATAGLSSSSAA